MNTVLSDESKKIFFLHIPKTGGTSFSEHLRDWYPNKKILNLPKDMQYLDILDDINKSGIICGHQFYPFTYIFNQPLILAFLREPIDRIISTFEFKKGKENHVNRKSHNKFTNTLSYFVTNRKKGIQNSNIQTKMLGIDYNLKNFTQNYLTLPKEKQQIVQNKISKIHCQECNEDNYSNAKIRLHQMAFFGIFEYYEESIKLFAKIMKKWLPTKIYHLNETPKTNLPRKLKYTQSETNSIVKYNDYDLKLYKYALNLFLDRYHEAFGVKVQENR